MWQILMTTDVKTAEKCAEALEPFCVAVSWIDTDEDGVVEVEGIAEEKPSRSVIKAALEAAVAGAIPPFTIGPLEEKDWLTLSYQAFPPKPLGRFWIHGCHVTEKPPAGSWPLQIDAATAFGSGEHPTTAGCLQALEQMSKRLRRPRKIMDMGTGSGILSVGAARAFRRPVYGVDIDPESVRVAGNHARANHMHRMIRLQAGNGFKAPLSRQKAPYDLLMANILAKPLCLMSRAGAQQVKRGGTIILAGLLHSQAPAVTNYWRRQGAHLVRKQPRGEWTILTFRKGAVR